MAKAIMIQGTTSNAGKSLLAAGLCRVFHQDGYKVAPFKSQNMALNSFITKDGFEMGRAQVMQAEAAGIAPDVRMNPILLKPTSDKGSQVIVNGEVLGNMNAKEYYAKKHELIPDIMKAYGELDAEYDIIVIEGAGSPAEINLKEQDIVNMGMARMAGAPVLIVGDIDKGGVFAALAGTMLLLTDEEKAMVKGTIINKFRGDVSILKRGLTMLEDIIHVPVVGVVPYLRIHVDDEDSLTERFERSQKPALVDIAVLRFPRISNFTDFNPLEYIEGVSLRYVGSVAELGDPDLIILPGTKNTMADLLWMRQCGLEASVLKHAAKGKPVFGVCGGYQMLGMTLKDPYGVEHGGEMAGLGLLDMDTIFERAKTRTQISGNLPALDGIFSSLSGLPYTGYEIHMGQSGREEKVVQSGNVYGSYLHGLFDQDGISKAIVEALLRAKGLDATAVQSFDMEQYKNQQYDRLADAVRESLDMEYIYRIMEEGVSQ
ncbi:cobyric acid synthase [Bianquea renquensis]|uniref:Cobyric acid synthase n=1 Tax=Bianquea renquensis TaxID=2763661 RepID=A0A926HVY4_9FIRM|nr:cobyric acid synthase [Bianquea renquensis]MBC8542132.1 cobyric acid synthase [Bianquea renquensis]